MSREILFRGKRVDNGEWVCGFLTCMNYIDVFTQKVCYDGQEELNYCTVEHCQVDKNTVGQFTGLCDKKGKKIFEGDILEFDGAEIPEEERAEVIYADGRFRLKNPRYDYMDDLDSLTASMEIIVGNTYDGVYGEDKRGAEE